MIPASGPNITGPNSSRDISIHYILIFLLRAAVLYTVLPVKNPARAKYVQSQSVLSRSREKAAIMLWV